MNAYRFLELVEEKQKIFERKKDELQNLEMLETNITATLKDDPVKSSRKTDSLGTLIINRIDFEKEVVVKAEEDFLKHRNACINLLEQVMKINFQQYNVLHLRYIEYLDLKDISDKEHYSYQRIKEIHAEGIKSFQKILDFSKVHTKSY